MKKGYQIITLLLAVILLISLSACGTDTGAQNGGQSDSPSSSSEHGENSSDTASREDTWENAQGQSGTMAYEYDGETLTKAVFKIGTSDKVWRTIEYSSHDDPNAGTCYDEIHYDANGTAIFNLEIKNHATENDSDVLFPSYISGFDFSFRDISCDILYTGNGKPETRLRKNTYSGAQDYWITEYGNDGLPEKTTVYYREGIRKATWVFYKEDGKIAYAMEYEYYSADFGELYRLEYTDTAVSFVAGTASVDAQGTVSGFTPDESKDVGITLKYDADGNVTKRTWRNETDSSYGITQTYTYDGDARIGSTYVYAKQNSDNEVTGRFVLNTDGTLASADYSYLNGSLGGGDTSYFVYEYYDNGVISHVKAYWASAENDEDDYLDIEWEKEFYESGKRKMECTYDSGYMKYYEDYYDENGEKTDHASGTYTEDGRKTPNQD